MGSKHVKIFTVLFLAVLVILTFYATSKQNKREEEGVKTVINTEKKENDKGKTTEENKIIEPPFDNVEEESKENVVTLSEDESADILQYKIHNCFVFGENTSYDIGGYKYFIIRSQSELKNYLLNRVLSSENNEKMSFNTEEIEEKLNSEFFEKGAVVALVYYNQNRKIDGKITNISVLQDELNIKFEKNNNSKDASNYITYIIPVETRSFKSIRVEY